MAQFSGNKKKFNWKPVAIGVVAIVIVVIGLLVFRVFNFVGAVSGTRNTDTLPTPDTQANQAFAQATATAYAKLCAVSSDACQISTTGAATPTAAVTGQPGSVITASPSRSAVTALPTVTTAATPAATDSKVVQKIKNGERITVLYMGYGSPGHEGEYLTDTVLVLSYDPKTQTVTQFNIPRDLWVSVPGFVGGKTFKSKINGIFSTIMTWEKADQSELDPKYRWTNKQEQHEAGANLVANTVQGILGIKIDHWLTMNFNAFRSLIDQMKGVTVCVDRAFTDNKYPRNDDDKIDAGVITVKFEKGCQLMSGETAIRFARSRNSQSEEGGDFARSARQMKVVSAIKDDVLKKDLIGNALGYMDALQGSLRVSLPLDELYSLATFFNSSEGKANMKAVKFAPEIMTGNNFLKEDDKGGIIGYVLVPQAGEDKYSDIQGFVQNSFQHSLLRRENVRIQVLNASGTPGRSNALTDFLDTQGFRQAEAEAVPTEDSTFLVDYTNGTASAHLDKLKGYLPGLEIVKKTADKKPYDNAPDLMLYLGQNYNGKIVTGGTTSQGQNEAQAQPQGQAGSVQAQVPATSTPKK